MVCTKMNIRSYNIMIRMKTLYTRVFTITERSLAVKISFDFLHPLKRPSQAS